jgi:hypothetical protein
MRICNLADGLGQLGQAMAELEQRWAETQLHWNDQTSCDFERDYLQPIPTQVQMLVAAVQVLAGTVDKATRELDDRGDET